MKDAFKRLAERIFMIERREESEGVDNDAEHSNPNGTSIIHVTSSPVEEPSCWSKLRNAC